jgi:phosphoglucosamine mutase
LPVAGTDGAVPRLFGTDGVRGVAGRPPLDRETVRRLGAAIVRVLGRHAPRVLIGRDTRESGPWIEAELALGAASQGARVESAGVVPTPAVAYLTRAQDYDLGVVISASHNPFEDNGIKVFSGRGVKFAEAAERAIEAAVADPSWPTPRGAAAPVTPVNLLDGYLDHLRAVLPDPAGLRGLPLVIDCANGATTTVAPALFRSIGASLTVMADAPDGRNINLDCGSTHPAQLARTVVGQNARLGIAFDGDGDRAIFVDEAGRTVDGDAVLLMCARQLLAEGRLRGRAVVATVMSNIGLEIALRDLGIDLVRCPVGDKYVMEEMAARGLSLGGEQSGHVIFADYLFTGDGLCTAVNVLRTMIATGRTLGSLASDLVAYPQVLLNLRVREKVDLASVPAVRDAMARVETRLAGHGRLLVRYSGTEPLLRVMLEGRKQDEIQAWAQEIIDAARDNLG